MPAVALFGGIALYYAGHVGFRLRNVGTLNRQRLRGGRRRAGADPAGASRSTRSSALALAAALTSGVIVYETIHFREARHRIRHEHGSM